MKSLSNLLGIVAAGALGFYAEPSLRHQLTGAQPQAAKGPQARQPAPPAAAAVPQIDPATLSPEQLPQQVLLFSDVRVTDAASGVTMKIEAGNTVKLLRIEGQNAVVNPGNGSSEGAIPIANTDLAQQLAANPTVTKPPATNPPVTKPPVTQTLPTVPSKLPEPAMPDPTPTAEPGPGSTGGPTPAAAPAAENVVAAMQASIRAGQIKEFKFDQVQEWTEQPAETIDGEDYQIGVASYKADTMFGVRTILAKALIKQGQVQRWVYLKSGMELK